MLMDAPLSCDTSEQTKPPLSQPHNDETVHLPDAERLTWITQNVMPHEPAIRSWLNRTTLPGMTADDIIQECYARFCSAPYQEILNGRAYFFSCARNLVFEHARRAKIVYIDANLGLEAQNVADSQPDPEQNFSSRQRLDWLKEQMMTLPSPCRDVFILRKIYNYSHTTIAQQLGLSLRAVERHISRGLQKLIEAGQNVE